MIVPDRILCSVAKRARQTADQAATAAGWEVPVKSMDSLYNAPAGDIFEVARSRANGIQRLMLVGHSPGVVDPTSLLVTAYDDLTLACDPATLIELSFDCTGWSDLVPDRGVLRLLLPS